VIAAGARAPSSTAGLRCRASNLVVHLGGSTITVQAEAYQPPVIRQSGPLGFQHALRGGRMDSNCLVPCPPVMAEMKVTLPDGRKGTFTPRFGDGKGGLLGLLAAD